MGDRAQRARENFFSGYNCAQSVLRAFYDQTGLSEETALLLGSSLGGGMGRLREVCGAVSAMFLLAGLRDGYTDPKAGEEKAAHYRRIQELARRFTAQNGSIVCRDLLKLGEGPDVPEPQERTASYYQKRPCGELIYDAALLFEEYCKENCAQEAAQ